MSAEPPVAFHVAYVTETDAALLQRATTLAVFGFGVAAATPCSDPRAVQVNLPPLAGPAVQELWQVDAPVTCGNTAGVRWASGGGWRFMVVEVDEVAGDIEAASEQAYRRLLAHVAASPEPHLQRIWNYLGAINDGAGDAERYRRFCNGRARGLVAHHVTLFPAATAIGHHGPRERLQVYALSACAPGQPLENPRQVSAWNYPRRYGPTAPSFARALRLPQGALAISGTAAVVGHASHHHDDVAAQADEACANLGALLEQAALPAFDAHAPLMVYVRHAADAARVEAALARRLDAAVPRIVLQGDVCRSELLVEIDGWAGLAA